jgi:CRISPR/Cas system-associated protein Cas10 (large subunit of type III CRISPR-Cas system)
MNDCEFCGRELHLSHYENNKEIAVYDCTHCPVLTSFYFLDKEGERIKTSFMLDRNEKVYIWTQNYIKGVSYITDVGVTLSAVRDKSPLLIKFPKIMNINPKNVHEKFSFYMVFL